MPYNCIPDAGDLSNFIYPQPTTRRLDTDGVVPVDGLLFLRSPPAVAGFVVPVVVDPVYCHPVRRFPHVLKKRRERVAPSVADGNPSATVARPPCRRRRIAPSDHAFPDGVHARSASPVDGHDVSVKAPTTDARPSYQRSKDYVPIGAASTTNVHAPWREGSIASSNRFADDGPPPKDRADSDMMPSNHLPNLLNRLVSGQRPRCVSSTSRLRSFYAVYAYSGAVR